MGVFKAVILSMRPAQWVKNLFVFLPMFFNGKLTDPERIVNGIIAFAAFSLTASAIYCLNDICDIDENRNHPRKRFRPIASGALSVPAAWILFAVLSVAGLTLSLTICPSWETGLAVIMSYYVLNVAYCLKISDIAIADVFCIATGFVIRVIGGGLACEIWVSPWIICMTFLLTLFLAFAKRRDDVMIREESGEITRDNTIGYNLRFMDQTLGLLGAVTMVCYIIYTMQPEVCQRIGSGHVYITSVFVLAGILRYLQIALVHGRSGNPTAILMRDRFVHVCIICWVITFSAIIYL